MFFIYECLKYHFVYCYYCERREFLIDAASAKILPASDSEHRPRRGGVRLGYRDLPSSDNELRSRVFQRGPASIYIFVGSASILAACPILLRFGFDHNSHEYLRARPRKTHDVNFEISNYLRPSFMGIGFGSGILLDLVLFADRIIAEPKSNRSILWDMEVCNDLNGVCAFF